MELNHLKTFYEVAKRGGFTSAARALRVSQPALSRAVRLLEESEGVRLFERGRQGVTLTEEGRIFFDACARIFRELEVLRTAASRGAGEVTGELSIAASDNLCNYVLPRLLPAFQRAHPRVRTRIFSGTSEQILGELRAQESEVGLFYTEVRDHRAFDCTPLWDVEFVAVCSAGLGTAGFETLGFVGSRAADYAKAYPALAMLRSAGIEPRTVVETNNQETQKQLVLAGLGYTLVPRHMVDEDLRAGRLRRLKTARTLKGTVYFVRKKGRAESRAAQKWRETLRSYHYGS
jgi:DNA-binding transcriptional LysR family regulator